MKDDIGCKVCIEFERQMAVSRWRARISSKREEIERWEQKASDLNTERFTHILLEHGAPLAPLD